MSSKLDDKHIKVDKNQRMKKNNPFSAVFACFSQRYSPQFCFILPERLTIISATYM